MIWEIAKFVGTTASGVLIAYLTFWATRKGQQDTAKASAQASRIAETQQALDAQRSIADQNAQRAEQFKQDADEAREQAREMRREFREAEDYWRQQQNCLAELVRKDILDQAGITEVELKQLEHKETE